MIFNQIDTQKNLILNHEIYTSNDEIDFNFEEFFTIDIKIKNVKRCHKKLRMIKCKKRMIKINKKSNEKNKLKFEIVMNSKAKINLINNVFVKQFRWLLFNVFNCKTMIIKNHSFKNYDIYFVQFEMQDENDVNRFFNDNFSKNESRMKYDVKFVMNAIIKNSNKLKNRQNRIVIIDCKINIFHHKSYRKKIESKELINAILNEKKEIFVMFVRVFHDENKNMNKMHIEWRIQIDSIFAKMKNKLNIKIIIFEILKEFVNLTNENKIYELFNHESNDHAIDLKSKFFFTILFIHCSKTSLKYCELI